MYKVGDLFSGMGGVALGFLNAGMDISWANEIDAKACVTYRSNFNHKLIEKDIYKLSVEEVEKVDILCGGFPCQAFSIAGYRKGFEDDRGELFFQIIRLAKELKPRVIFLENVKNLVTHDGGNTFRVIKETLKKNGYHVKDKVMNTHEYSDVPQNRERIYIVAFQEKLSADNFKFPEANKNKKEISEILESKVEENFYYEKSKIFEKIKDEIVEENKIYQWRRVYVRENKSGVCPTLTANMGTGGHNVPLINDKGRIRKLTPRECARFQGFPNNYKFPKQMANSSLYKQIGNSVSVPVIEKVANSIKKTLLISDNLEKTETHVYKQTA